MERFLPDPGISLKLGATRWRVIYQDELLLEALRNFHYEAAQSNPRFELTKHDQKVIWGRLKVNGRAYFLKGRKVEQLRRRLESVVKRSPLRKEWQKTWWVRSNGVETVEPIAVGEVRTLRQLRYNLFVCRWIEGSQPLKTFLQDKREQLPAEEYEAFRVQMINRLGYVFGSLHAIGTYHREFHPSNILVFNDSSSHMHVLPIDYKHLSVPRVFTKHDWAWSFYQVTWWMKEPIISWERKGRDIENFVKGYYNAAPRSAPSFEALLDRVNGVIPKKPLVRKPRRKNCFIDPTATSVREKN